MAFEPGSSGAVHDSAIVVIVDVPAVRSVGRPGRVASTTVPETTILRGLSLASSSVHSVVSVSSYRRSAMLHPSAESTSSSWDTVECRTASGPVARTTTKYVVAALSVVFAGAVNGLVSPAVTPEEPESSTCSAPGRPELSGACRLTRSVVRG